MGDEYRARVTYVLVHRSTGVVGRSVGGWSRYKWAPSLRLQAVNLAELNFPVDHALPRQEYGAGTKIFD